jgi:hypothetical protein
VATPDSPAPARPARSGSSALRIALAVLIVGGIGGALAFYGESIGGYVAQQGWNPGSAEQVVRQFIDLANQPKGGEAAAALLDTTAPDNYKPTIEDGRLVKITYGQGLSRRTDPLKLFVPEREIRAVRTDLVTRDGGVFRVLVQFASGKWGEYRVRREGGAPRILQLPTGFSDTPPERHTFEY